MALEMIHKQMDVDAGLFAIAMAGVTMVLTERSQVSHYLVRNLKV